METKPLLWVSTVMAICMSSRRFMGRAWLVRDDFGIEFQASFRWNRGFWRSFIWFIYIFHLYTFISLHWMFTTCLAVEVWYVKRCRRSMSKGDRVTFLGCCEGTIDDFDKDGAPVCFGVWHRAHRAHAIYFIHTMQRMQSSLWSSGLWSLRCMLCIAMCIYVTESHFFHCCSLQIPSTVTTLFTFLYTQTQLMNSWQITWWWRSTVVALTCGVAATWQPVWAHSQFNTIPGIIHMYTYILYIIAYIYIHICMIYAHVFTFKYVYFV